MQEAMGVIEGITKLTFFVDAEMNCKLLQGSFKP